MMRGIVNDKIISQIRKKKYNNDKKKCRCLISINVFGSAGPIRFVVNEDDVAAAVIDTALKSYAREGRLPVLGFDANNFILYCANASSDALSPEEKIGSRKGRNFVLCKKQLQPQMTEGRSEIVAHKGKGWKAWLNKSFKLKK
ncbi:hypothetical protein CFOL_v3_20189 [Cephalotus follicularis]|uniref:DUF7054 domain-containing protein n=1 Tax=Cephalotus follicularis TaxID=3775 RepID=A0A1Q3C8Z5_CEPFO|nr:hypothetical protein CFOL_v3_20189 [Cephalotus follicularis]